MCTHTRTHTHAYIHIYSLLTSGFSCIPDSEPLTRPRTSVGLVYNIKSYNSIHHTHKPIILPTDTSMESDEWTHQRLWLLSGLATSTSTSESSSVSSSLLSSIVEWKYTDRQSNAEKWYEYILRYSLGPMWKGVCVCGCMPACVWAKYW